MKQFKFIAILFFTLLTQAAFASNDPVAMLEGSADKILSTLKQNKASLKSNPSIIHNAVQTNLLPHVDVYGMSRSVLGRNAWNKATRAEKKEFSKAFTQLVIRTYSSPLAQYTDEKIKFLKSRAQASGKFMRVNSVILRSNGQRIPLSYSLVNKRGEWKIYDLTVEGVSLLQSFRSQFAQALQGSNMAALIQKLNNHNHKKG